MPLIWKFAIIIVCCVVFYITCNHIQHRRYLKHAKQGTRCTFFIENDRYVGYIISRKGEKLNIHCEGRNYDRNINDTYPL